ncbi:alpha/beta hydrolase [Aquibacillus salsiterrae]|uniref:Alpha/beta hydrolase n=1 Tax=Aquibacillus salsiterrae TaxID=2950439 RepID=A0A9X3WF51_9BACI|nr:alpha/beta hydrolase [Aquibacillus salsiterrae]MDC3415906.1 alpha/beta hydrolase [Aquibacillus salsiterrae]
MINMEMKIWENTKQWRVEDTNIPRLETYVLKGETERPAVLICPGGGYAHLSEREAEPIALAFNEAGFHAFVLYYTVTPKNYEQPIQDVARAMCIIRDRAETWKVQSDKIAVCGFSAGGHLAASLGVHWDKEHLYQVEGIEVGKNKPNALILSYPVISAGPNRHQGSFDNLLGDSASEDLYQEMSLENHISPQTPPTFLWHTVEDEAVPVENSLLFAQGLRKVNVPFELHIYPKGVHGLSLATKETATNERMADPHVATWMKLCKEWLTETFE